MVLSFSCNYRFTIQHLTLAVGAPYSQNTIFLHPPAHLALVATARAKDGRCQVLESLVRAYPSASHIRVRDGIVALGTVDSNI